MPLSEHERRQFEQIEAALRDSDPRFADAVRAADPRVRYRRRVIAAALGFVVGIGLLLAGVALILGRETGALMIGERTNRSKTKKVEEIINADPSVEKAGDLLTMQLGPNQVLLTVQIRFRQDLDIPTLESAIDRIEKRIREEEPEIQRIFIEAESFRHGGDESRKAA